MVIEKPQESQGYRTEDMNVEKYKFDENNGLWYELQGDYYLPCLRLPEEEQAYIGIWGQRHLRYLKKHHRVLYGNLLTSGKLNSYLVDIDRQAEKMFERLVKQMAEREGVTEQLKAANSMEWVRKLNSIFIILIQKLHRKGSCRVAFAAYMYTTVPVNGSKKAKSIAHTPCLLLYSIKPSVPQTGLAAIKSQDVFSPNRQIGTFVLYNCSRKAPDIQGFFPMLRTAF